MIYLTEFIIFPVHVNEQTIIMWYRWKYYQMSKVSILDVELVETRVYNMCTDYYVILL